MGKGFQVYLWYYTRFLFKKQRSDKYEKKLVSVKYARYVSICQFSIHLKHFTIQGTNTFKNNKCIDVKDYYHSRCLWMLMGIA